METMNDLRSELFETMRLLKVGKIDVQTAKMVSDLGQTIINTAKVEVDFIKETGGKGSGFIEPDTQPRLERPKSEYSNDGHSRLLEKYGNKL